MGCLGLFSFNSGSSVDFRGGFLAPENPPSSFLLIQSQHYYLIHLSGLHGHLSGGAVHCRTLYAIDLRHVQSSRGPGMPVLWSLHVQRLPTLGAPLWDLSPGPKQMIIFDLRHGSLPICKPVVIYFFLLVLQPMRLALDSVL